MVEEPAVHLERLVRHSLPGEKLWRRRRALWKLVSLVEGVGLGEKREAKVDESQAARRKTNVFGLSGAARHPRGRKVFGDGADLALKREPGEEARQVVVAGRCDGDISEMNI